MEKATFDEDNNLWAIETDEGEVVRARYFIMSVGCLSAPIRPKFNRENDFRGEVYQTSLWPKEPVDFTGKRVGIIGSGSSAIQSAPLISQDAAHVYLYQRTPNFVVPSQNRPLSDEDVNLIKSDYEGFRKQAYAENSAFRFLRYDQSVFDLPPEERRARLDQQWEIGGLPFLGGFNDILTNEDANKEVANYWRDRISEIVKDDEVLDRLTPDEIFGLQAALCRNKLLRNI